MTEQHRDNRLVRLATLWQRTSQKTGKTYFAGYMGDVQLVMFDGGEQDHPTRPGERVHVWRLFVQERDPERRPQARQERPSQDLPAGQTRIVRNERKDARQAHVEELSARFEPDSEIPF